MAGEQNIELINAISFARGTQEPTNREVFWIDENITGEVYEQLKYFNSETGGWQLVQRTAEQLLDAIKTVDGAGSGLDADTLQGYTPAQLMSSGEGGSTPPLSTGEMLVGQADGTGTAQTIGGIATVNTSGQLAYVPNSISHLQLSDIGSNTHAQIDSHISSTANPHNVTPSQVGNTTAQWNANSIEGNETNIGTLGSGEDGQVLTWDNATSKFIMTSASGGGDTIFTGGTFTGNSTVDLAGNELTFDCGAIPFNGQGIIIDGSTSGNNGDILTIKTPTTESVFNEDGDLTIGRHLFSNNNLIQLKGNSNSYVYCGLSNIKLGREASGRHVSISQNGLDFVDSGGNIDHEIEFDAKIQFCKNGIGTSGYFTVGNTSLIGTEKISLRNSTAIQGTGTSTGTTLALYDNDATPIKTWEWLDNGNVNIGQDTVFNLGNKDLNFEGSGLTKISNGSRYVGVPDWNTHTYFDINNGTTSAQFIMANASSAYNQDEFSLDVGSFQPIRVQGSTIALGGGFGKNDFNSSYRINLKGGVYGDDGDLVFTDSINELAFDFDNYPKLKIKTSSNEWWMIEGDGTGVNFTNGDLYIYDSTNNRKMMQFKAGGTINMPNLPTSSSGLSSGDLWNDGGTLKIV